MPSRETPAPTHAPTDHIRNASSRTHVLLVESDPMERQSVASFLSSHDFGLTSCGTVGDALTYDGPLHFALIGLEVSDRPGWHLWNHLATDEREPMALFLGTDPEVWERLSLRDNPRTRFLKKPFHEEDLLRALMDLERNRLP